MYLHWKLYYLCDSTSSLFCSYRERRSFGVIFWCFQQLKWYNCQGNTQPSCQGLSGDGWAAVKAQRLEGMGNEEIRECRTPWVWCTWEGAAFLGVLSGEPGVQGEAGHWIPSLPMCCPAGAAGIAQSWELLSHGMGTICCTWCHHISSLKALCSQACCWLCKKPAKPKALMVLCGRNQRISKENGLL